jgi:hypothetical protein
MFALQEFFLFRESCNLKFACPAGGVLFKVYIFGHQIRFAWRFSFPGMQEVKDVSAVVRFLSQECPMQLLQLKKLIWILKLLVKIHFSPVLGAPTLILQFCCLQFLVLGQAEQEEIGGVSGFG